MQPSGTPPFAPGPAASSESSSESASANAADRSAAPRFAPAPAAAGVPSGAASGVASGVASGAAVDAPKFAPAPAGVVTADPAEASVPRRPLFAPAPAPRPPVADMAPSPTPAQRPLPAGGVARPPVAATAEPGSSLPVLASAPRPIPPVQVVLEHLERLSRDHARVVAELEKTQAVVAELMGMALDANDGAASASVTGVAPAVTGMPETSAMTMQAPDPQTGVTEIKASNTDVTLRVESEGEFGIGVKAVGGLYAVHGYTETGIAGVWGMGPKTGVVGDGLRVGVSGSSPSGIGVRAEGRTQLQMVPAAEAGAPTAGLHEIGEMHMDAAGVLRVCVDEGVPGVWVRPGLNVLDAPVRVHTGMADAASVAVAVPSEIPVPAAALSALVVSVDGGAWTIVPAGGQVAVECGHVDIDVVAFLV